MKHDFRSLADARLSSLAFTAADRARVHDKLRGARRVRMRRAAAAALLAALLLCAALALALSDAFFRRAGELQEQKGGLNAWTLAEKRALIGLMAESGVTLPQDAAQALAAMPDGEQAERLANALLAEGKTARDALKERFAFTENTFSYFTAHTGYDAENACWVVTYATRLYAQYAGEYAVRIDAATQRVTACDWSLAGAADAWDAATLDRLSAMEAAHEQAMDELAAQKNPEEWTLEDKAAIDAIYLESGFPRFDRYFHTLPAGDDIPCEEAIARAKSLLMEREGTPAGVLDACTVDVSFMLAPEGDRVWIMAFEDAAGETACWVELRSPSGAVELCIWYGKPQQESTPTPVPEGAAQAEALARAALCDTFGFEARTAECFNALCEQTAQGMRVTLRSNTINTRITGDYVFVIREGAVVSAVWTLAGEYAAQGASEPWSHAALWSAYEYNQWTLLREQARALLQQAEAATDWRQSFEALAARDALYRAAGYDRRQYCLGLPGYGDLTAEQAVARAREAVSAGYGCEGGALAVVSVAFDVSEEANCRYRVALQLQEENGNSDFYTVVLAGDTGETLELSRTDGSNG